MTRLARRLPGFRFEVQAPALPEVLPRMDIAAFVGFAASGPVNTPVAVEDAVHFAAIFGEDVPLAWDTRRGEQLYAYLGPAVRAFFDNGGRRAWIVRVAGKTARSNYFPVSGLLEASFDQNGEITGFRPAFAPARSVGSWSDSFQVGSALLSQPLKLEALSFNGSEVTAEIAPSMALTLTRGDLLRFSFRAEGLNLLLKINRVETNNRKRMVVYGTLKGWFAALKELTGLENPTIYKFGPRLESDRLSLTGPFAGFDPGSESGQPMVTTRLARFDLKKGQVVLTLNLSLAEAPPPSTLLRLDFGENKQGWLAVQEVRPADLAGSVEIAGPVMRWLQDGPPDLPSLLAENLEVERLSFELWARRGENNPARLPDLTFEADHPRFWGGLPTDEQLYDGIDSEAADKYADIWQGAAISRFPLAGGSGSFYLPLFIEGLPQDFNGPAAQTLSGLERDGLDEFSVKLFVDPELAGLGTADLITQADFLRYQALVPRKLAGIHSLLGVEEVTILALPDLVQRGWSSFTPPDQLPAQPSSLLSHPEWFRCFDPAQARSAQGPDWSNFLDCGLLLIDPPGNLRSTSPDPGGTFRLEWSRVAVEGIIYLLEEATRPDWTNATTIYTGKAPEYTLYGREQGDYYYRVRAVAGLASSEWSVGLPVRVSPPNNWQLLAVDAYRPETLLAVQQAALRMCAARGDLLAVLSLPEHYREDNTLQHLATLRLLSGTSTALSGVLPLSFGETGALSYGAIYHPWLISRYNGTLQRIPPDGTACGIMAKRTVERGAWIAPANELWPGLVALTPPIGEDYRLDLQEARLNLIRQEPRGFTVLNADTLSLDEDLRQINVRRLLILLRRMALKLGATYVFEPNDTALDRLVQGGFESMLEQLFARGAFAGATPAAAFQVVTAPLNLGQSREQGRFVVEIRVAPALPMTFMTLRLVQADDRGTVTEVL